MLSLDHAVTVIPKAGPCEVSAPHSFCTMAPVHVGGGYLPKAGEDDDEWWQEIAKELLVDGGSDGPDRKLEIPSGILGDGPLAQFDWMKMVEVNVCGEKINSFEMVDTMYDGEMFTLTLAADDLVDTSPLIDQMDYTAAAMILVMGGTTASGQQWFQKIGIKNDLSPSAIPVHFANAMWGDYLVLETVGETAAGGEFCLEEPAPEPDILETFFLWAMELIRGYGQ